MSTTMRKVVISAFGGPSNLEIVNAQLPSPAKNEVQVSIIYAGFSGADANMLRGTYPMQRAAPLTPGYCFLGRVRANGPGSSAYKVGDVVTALTVYDSDAEMLNIQEKYLVPVPDGLDLQQVTALTLDWNTAYGMVTRAAKVSKGQRVFIHGLSGAVGYALMSLSLLQGAKVYGTASERNHAALRELGVEPFVYTNKNWIDKIKSLGGVHAVFDPLGFESYDESYSILTSDEPSILVGYGGNRSTLNNEEPRSQFPSLMKLFARKAMIFCNKDVTFYYISRDQKTFRPELQALMQFLKEDKIRVPIKHVWEMEHIREAHESWGKVSGMGSLLIRVADEK